MLFAVHMVDIDLIRSCLPPEKMVRLSRVMLVVINVLRPGEHRGGLTSLGANRVQLGSGVIQWVIYSCNTRNNTPNNARNHP